MALLGEAVLMGSLAAAALLSACGQRGPLYMPEHNTRVITRPASSAPSSAPETPPASAAAPERK